MKQSIMDAEKLKMKHTKEQMPKSGTSASIEQNPMLSVRAVYVIQVDKGSWDDFAWWIHGIYDCPFKADEEKRRYLAQIEEEKESEDFSTALQAESINEVNVEEYRLNEVASVK